MNMMATPQIKDRLEYNVPWEGQMKKSIIALHLLLCLLVASSLLAQDAGCTAPFKGINMVAIPGGTFQMGSEGQAKDELPVHMVRLDAFCMSTTEITVGQVQAVTGKTPQGLSWTPPPRTSEDSLRRARRDSLAALPRGQGRERRRREPENPKAAVAISWNGAVEFCNALSRMAGLEPCYDLETWDCDFAKNGFRLPTEAEWEYACRGGTRTVYFSGDDPESLMPYAWFDQKTETINERLVGKKKPNPFGLYDMLGNVWEWCNDWYRHDYYIQSPEENPTGPPSSRWGLMRVCRGGSRSSGPLACRSATRRGNPPAARNSTIGFRVVCRTYQK
jgi:formylglycine-generating enzyme required for sulfatase activity